MVRFESSRAIASQQRRLGWVLPRRMIKCCTASNEVMFCRSCLKLPLDANKRGGGSGAGVRNREFGFGRCRGHKPGCDCQRQRPRTGKKQRNYQPTLDGRRRRPDCVDLGAFVSGHAAHRLIPACGSHAIWVGKDSRSKYPRSRKKLTTYRTEQTMNSVIYFALHSVQPTESAFGFGLGSVAVSIVRDNDYILTTTAIDRTFLLWETRLFWI